jgi:hypothetical protein
MASQEVIGKTCVDVKLLRTTEGLYQNSAILVLLHYYGRFLGAYIMVI